MLLACKYEETYAPEIEDFVYVSDKAFVADDVIAFEGHMCNALGFFFSAPTPYHFAERFILSAELDERMTHFAFYLMELAMLEYSFVSYPPSVIAASAVYLTTYFDGAPWVRALSESGQQAAG